MIAQNLNREMLWMVVKLYLKRLGILMMILETEFCALASLNFPSQKMMESQHHNVQCNTFHPTKYQFFPILTWSFCINSPENSVLLNVPKSLFFQHLPWMHMRLRASPCQVLSLICRVVNALNHHMSWSLEWLHLTAFWSSETLIRANISPSIWGDLSGKQKVKIFAPLHYNMMWLQ